MKLRLAPNFGARITELTDLRNARNWIVSGACEGSASDAANYLDVAPNGWDECFPTVAACDVDEWGGRLRDHGLLWGRPWRCFATNTGIVATYEDRRFRFRRAIRLAGEYVLVRYTLTSLHSAPLPWLWSQHCLLACEAGEFIETSGLEAWQDADRKQVSLTPVLGRDAGVAGKYFAPVGKRAKVALCGARGRFEISWRQSDACWAEFWFSYGGWPVEQPLYQIGIEPASAPHGRLSEAIEKRNAKRLSAGQTLHWHCRMRVSTDEIDAF